MINVVNNLKIVLLFDIFIMYYNYLEKKNSIFFIILYI